MRKLHPVFRFLAAIIFGWMISVVITAAANQPAQLVTVLFFNDVHGHLTPFKVKTDQGKVQMGGVARMATMIKSIRAENTAKGIPTVVLIAGDILQGTPMSTVFQGIPDVECFNAMGVDAMTIGNHEFDFGVKNFLTLKKQASFPFLSSNIVWRTSGKRVGQPSADIALSETMSLTVIGVTTRNLLVTTAPANVKDLSVLDPVEAVTGVFERLGEKGPVILLSHSKHTTDRAIAEAIPGLTAIIGGHDQILMDPVRRVGDVPVFQAFEKGKYLGRIDLSIEPDSKKAVLISSSYIPVLAAIVPDPEIAGIIDRYRSQLDKKFKDVIGRAVTFLDAERERARYEETNLGNLVTDIVREYTGADIALVNSGGLRASIDEGPIRLEDVFKTMPFANEIVLLELTDSDIAQALMRSVQGTREDEDGGFLQVSGIKFTIRGQRVEDIRVGPKSEPLEPDRVYTVAVPDFLAAGGDGYTIFKGKAQYNTGSPLRELIVDTIRTRKVVSAEIEGRIVRLD